MNYRSLSIYAGFYALLGGFVTPVIADITPSFVVVKELSLGQILYTTGNCEINARTSAVDSLPPSQLCIGSGGGRAGHYTIIANPNKQISFQMDQKDDEDGFIFMPSGELESDAETVPFTSNVAVQIDSGPTGVVDIYVGGQFFVTETLSPGSTYNYEKTNGITWSELP